MTNFNFKKLAQLGSVTLIGLTTITLGACSTTSGTMAAQGAPITYKVDQGGFQQASLTKPYSSVLPQAPTNRALANRAPRSSTPAPRHVAELAPSIPKYNAPKPTAPIYKAPKPATPKFDMSSVDTDLYAHQRVGKPYTVLGKRYTPKHQPRYNKVGTASWYGPKFHGKLTANGEKYDMNGMTAAHKTLPLNSMVLVTNVENGKFLKVRINDRGPFVGDRIIDLSKAAASQLGLFNSGLGKVRVQYAGPADPMASRSSIHNQPALPKVEPTPRLAPDSVAELPSYKPLRDLGIVPAPVAQPLAGPQPQTNSQARFPFEPKTMIPQPQHPQAVIPQPTAPQNAQLPKVPSGDVEDGPVTLTIKGPVHMASAKNDGSQTQARFIPAVNYKTLPAGK